MEESENTLCGASDCNKGGPHVLAVIGLLNRRGSGGASVISHTRGRFHIVRNNYNYSPLVV